MELTTVSSNYHVELNSNDAGFQDKYVVQEIIKEMVKSRPININGNKGYKVLVLNEVDKLSKEALQLPIGFADNQLVHPMDWEQYISEISSYILNETGLPHKKKSPWPRKGGFSQGKCVRRNPRHELKQSRRSLM